MYILKNAVKSITRNKLRNILIGIIVLIIAISACLALSIRQASSVAKEDALNNLSIKAQISFDRTKAMEEMANTTETSGTDTGLSQGRGRQKFDFSVLQGSSLTLDDYLNYAKAQQDGDSYYYSMGISLNAVGDLLPYGTEEDSSTEESLSTSTNDTQAPTNMPEGNMKGGMQGGGRGFGMSQGDFSITGYSSYDAMLSLFGENGSCSITDGEMFDVESDELTCVISNELALYNSLSIGDTITLSNPDYEDETYSLKIVGIYTDSSSSSEENSRFAMSDPANNIYMSYNAVEKLCTASEEAGNKTTNNNNEQVSAALTGSLAFTYTFKNSDNYNTFTEKVKDLGLSDDYTVSSSDITTFEKSIAPLETLSNMAMWFLLIVLVVGGVILVTLNIFNLRERKYEIGVLTSIGMKKVKVAFQFVMELFIVTFIAVIIGAGIGASVSVPVTNALLESQVASAQESNDNNSKNFGFERGGEQGGGNMPDMKSNKLSTRDSAAVEYVNSVSSATNIYVIIQLIGIGLLLTVVSSIAALISIMRYEPLKILSGRS